MNAERFIAQILPANTPTISPAIWDFLLVGGVITGLAVVIFIVTAISRKSKRARRRRKRGPEILRNSEELLREQEADDASARESKKSRRKKRRHHDRPRQQLPTLAESGGLPPIRDENTPPNTSL